MAGTTTTPDMSLLGNVFDVKRFALHDGPGIRTTVFLKGCPLACKWCHNPESQRANAELLNDHSRCRGCGACVSACPEGAIRLVESLAITDRSLCRACGACLSCCPGHLRSIVGQQIRVMDVLEEVQRDLLFYDQSGGGVTLSGGDPLAQPAFCESLLHHCQRAGIHTAVDTCGYAAPDVLDRIADATDLFLYDIKHLDSQRHLETTGVANSLVLTNLKRLVERKQRIWIRVPLIPGINNADEDLEILGSWIGALSGIECIRLLPYHTIGEAKRDRLDQERAVTYGPSSSTIPAEHAAEILRRTAGCPVSIGG